MNLSNKSKLVESCRKFASKNTFCLYISIAYIALMVFCNVLKKYFGTFFLRIVSLAAICAAFLFIGSYAPVSYMDYSGNDDIVSDITKAKVSDTSDAYDYDLSKEETSNEQWCTVLINKKNKIPENYEFELGTINGNLKCDSRIVEPLQLMLEAAKEDGVTLRVCSPYRSINRQVFLFNKKVKNYMNAGFSYLEAYKTASTEVTVPGSSEHEIGLALDIVSADYYRLDEGFAKTDAGKWLAAHSWEYGFILRYPKNKEAITGISYEPWHYRYVGEDNARIIKEKNITLEEYVEGL